MRQVIQLSTSRCGPCRVLYKMTETLLEGETENYQKIDIDLLEKNAEGETLIPSEEVYLASKAMKDKMVDSVPFLAFFEDGKIVDLIYPPRIMEAILPTLDKTPARSLSQMSQAIVKFLIPETDEEE